MKKSGPYQVQLDHLQIRAARDADADALERLAALDGSAPPRGAGLVALVDGQLAAYLPFEGGPALADPFAPTRDVVAMLSVRRDQLRVAPRGARRRLTLRARRRANA